MRFETMLQDLLPSADAAILETILFEHDASDARHQSYVQSLHDSTNSLNLHTAHSRRQTDSNIVMMQNKLEALMNTNALAESTQITGLSQHLDTLSLANNAPIENVAQRLARLEAEVKHLPDSIIQRQNDYLTFLSNNIARVTEEIDQLRRETQWQHSHHKVDSNGCVKLQSCIHRTVSNAISFITTPQIKTDLSLSSALPLDALFRHDPRNGLPRFSDAVSTILSEDLVAAILLTTCATIYQCSPAEALLQRLKMRSSKDPLFMVMILLAMIFLAKALRRLPQQISMLSDNNIMFQDALGSPPFKVSAAYWTHHELFHGFLCFYYSDKPGSRHVRTKQYRLLEGVNELGDVIEEAKWQTVVRACVRVTMVVVVDVMDEDMRIRCPECSRVCQQQNIEVLSCPACKRSFITAVSHASPLPTTEDCKVVSEDTSKGETDPSISRGQQRRRISSIDQTNTPGIFKYLHALIRAASMPVAGDTNLANIKFMVHQLIALPITVKRSREWTDGELTELIKIDWRWLHHDSATAVSWRGEVLKATHPAATYVEIKKRQCAGCGLEFEDLNGHISTHHFWAPKTRPMPPYESHYGPPQSHYSQTDRGEYRSGSDVNDDFDFAESLMAKHGSRRDQEVYDDSSPMTGDQLWDLTEFGSEDEDEIPEELPTDDYRYMKVDKWTSSRFSPAEWAEKLRAESWAVPDTVARPTDSTSIDRLATFQGYNNFVVQLPLNHPAAKNARSKTRSRSIGF